MAKKTKLTGNMLIAQSGGPTVVINQSLIGAVIEAKKHKQIKNIYGSLHGIKGILDERFIDLGKESRANLEAVANTPSSGLGSVRKKPKPEDCAKMFAIMKKYNIRYFFYIGGNDSAETAHIVNEEAKRQNYELRCFHIPKTIDNDLRENDHTPGFASGAKFVAMAFMGDNLDNRALPGVKINIVMGRHAGFLTAASALARVYPDDGPHLIYLPERPFHIEKFAADVKAVYAKYGRCVVAASEGISDAEGTPMTLVESSRLCTRSATRRFVLARMSSLTTPAGRWVASTMCTPRVRPTAATLTSEASTSGKSLASIANSSMTSSSRGNGSAGLVAR